MNWFTVDEKNPALVHVDADVYMPGALDEIASFGRDDMPRAIALEIARQWRHWDLSIQLRRSGKFLHDQTMIRVVTGDKDMWNVGNSVTAEERDLVTTVEWSRKVGIEARELYKLARGHAPA